MLLKTWQQSPLWLFKIIHWTIVRCHLRRVPRFNIWRWINLVSIRRHRRRAMLVQSVQLPKHGKLFLSFSQDFFVLYLFLLDLLFFLSNPRLYLLYLLFNLLSSTTYLLLLPLCLLLHIWINKFVGFSINYLIKDMRSLTSLHTFLCLSVKVISANFAFLKTRKSGVWFAPWLCFGLLFHARVKVSWLFDHQVIEIFLDALNMWRL